MKPTSVLPPGAVLPPMATADAKVVDTRQASRKGGKRPARGPKQHSGRFALLNAFVDGVMGSLPRAAALVWLALFRDTKPDGLARTGTADLARRVGCDPSSVKRAVRLLVNGGHLEVVRRGGLGRGPSIYRVK